MFALRSDICLLCEQKDYEQVQFEEGGHGACRWHGGDGTRIGGGSFPAAVNLRPDACVEGSLNGKVVCYILPADFIPAGHYCKVTATGGSNISADASLVDSEDIAEERIPIAYIEVPEDILLYIVNPNEVAAMSAKLADDCNLSTVPYWDEENEKRLPFQICLYPVVTPAYW